MHLMLAQLSPIHYHKTESVEKVIWYCCSSIIIDVSSSSTVALVALAEMSEIVFGTRVFSIGIDTHRHSETPLSSL